MASLDIEIQSLLRDAQEFWSDEDRRACRQILLDHSAKLHARFKRIATVDPVFAELYDNIQRDVKKLLAC